MASVARLLVFLYLSALFAVLKLVGCFKRFDLQATDILQSKSKFNYSKSEWVRYYIQRDIGYSDFYLEITWSSTFNVIGSMPNCKGDYITVYLTRSYRNAGRFCSLNAGKPFSMFSHDGTAMIEFRSDKSKNGAGFKFYFQLKPRFSRQLAVGTPICKNANNDSASGVFYSSGWPDGYQSSPSDCYYSILQKSAYDTIMILFMDIDLNSPDNVKIYGSKNASSYLQYLGTPKSFSRFTTRYKYVKIEFTRTRGGFMDRGFVAGYIKYRNTYNTEKVDSQFPIAAYPGIAFIFIIFFCICRKRKRNAPRQINPPPQNAAAPVGTDQEMNNALENPGFSEETPPEETSPDKIPVDSLPSTYPPLSHPISTLTTDPPPVYATAITNYEGPPPAVFVPELQHPAMMELGPLPDVPPPSYDSVLHNS